MNVRLKMDWGRKGQVWVRRRKSLILV